ncbi:MAG: hypothetical protein ABUS57_11295, partial [Pseudomonadota bacterium]
MKATFMVSYRTGAGRAPGSKVLACLLAAVLLVSCGGAGTPRSRAFGRTSAGGGDGPVTYVLGGTVSGLPAGGSVVLTNNGAENLSVAANGAFQFATHYMANAGYLVAVKTQPANATCTVVNFAGLMPAAAVGSVQVVCTPYTGTLFFFDDFIRSSSSNNNTTALGNDWALLLRHGAYFQDETECNTADHVGVTGGLLTIRTTATPTLCGDFNLDGSHRQAAETWPYATGGVQWRTKNFTYGTLDVRAKIPAAATQTWPAIWLIGANCQATNVFTADVDYDT